MADGNDDWARINLSHAVTYSVEALKTSLLVNGGAAIALFTLVGTLSNKDGAKFELELHSVRNAILSFGCGVAFVSLSFGVAYVAQIFFLRHNQDLSYTSAKAANIFRYVALALFLASVAAFFIGIIAAVSGLRLAPSHS